MSERTRDAVLARAQPLPAVDGADALTDTERATLRALTARIVPQRAEVAIDLASRIEAAFAHGDGWRFATLPPDRDAYRAGLRTLDRLGFALLDAEAQDAILARAHAGDLADARFDAQQVRRWFEDVRADAVKAYVAHPATMARIGYSGVAYGGDGERLQGFSALEPGAREAWEPLARSDAP